jgi:flagellar biosynthesis/type III secretory pathway protein FliH
MAQALANARDEGYEDGLEKGRLEVLDWLQEKYLADDAPARGSKKAQALLQLAREAAEHFQPLVGAAKPKKKAKKL